MTKERFEEIAQGAFDSLPDQFRDSIENVHVVVEDYPPDELVENGHYGKYSLLGLYQGIPLTRRGTWYGATPTGPDKISLYQKNIEASCSSEEEIRDRIIEVLFHEIGHYFGMSEKQIRSAMKNFR
ncbi:MAG TPA: metallopeptidase family protein [Bacteroidota bacterium]